MKYSGQISTGQYEFIAFELESDDPYEAVACFQSLKNASKTGEGIGNKDWCRLLDQFLQTGTVENGGEVWEDLSEYQRQVCQEIKRALKRIEGQDLKGIPGTEH